MDINGMFDKVSWLDRQNILWYAKISWLDKEHYDNRFILFLFYSFNIFRTGEMFENYFSLTILTSAQYSVSLHLKYWHSLVINEWVKKKKKICN